MDAGWITWYVWYGILVWYDGIVVCNVDESARSRQPFLSLSLTLYKSSLSSFFLRFELVRLFFRSKIKSNQISYSTSPATGISPCGNLQIDPDRPDCQLTPCWFSAPSPSHKADCYFYPASSLSLFLSTVFSSFIFWFGSV